MAVMNDGRLEQAPRTLTAGVDAAQDCGVSCGVGRSPSLCKAGKVGFEDSTQGEGSDGVIFSLELVGDCSSVGEQIELMLLTRDTQRRGDGESACKSRLKSLDGLEGSTSTVTRSGVNRGINVFQQSSGLGDALGPEVYLRTISVQR
jgi:hypothetical protein